VLTMMWMSSRAADKSEDMERQGRQTGRMYRVLFGSHESNHAPFGDKNNVEGILIARECRSSGFRSHVPSSSLWAPARRRLGTLGLDPVGGNVMRMLPSQNRVLTA